MPLPGRTIRLAAALMLTGSALTGCPRDPLGASAFSVDASANRIPDGGTAGDGGTSDTVTADVPLGDSEGGGADAAATDAGALPCTGPLAQWFTKSIDGPQYEQARAVEPLPGGGVIVVGDAGSDTYKLQARLTRLSSYGTVLWHRTFGSGEKEDRGEAVAVVDDGFCIAGHIRSVSNGSSDGWLIRTDTDGEALWQKNYGGDRSDHFEGIVAVEGGFVAAGTNRSIDQGQEDGWLVRVDAKGTLLWQDVYGGSSIDELRDVVANGAGFAAAGENWSNASAGSDAWLLLVDAKGKQTASKVYSRGDKDWARALVRMPDGGFALTGKASDKGNPKLWVIRTDSEGNVLWESMQGGNQSEQGWGLAVTPGGGLAVVGDANTGKTGVDAWQLRYDAAGNLLWDQRYGGPGNQWATDVVALGDSGTLLVGRAWNGGSKSDVFLVRSGPWGHGACAAVGACGAKQAADCDDGLPCTVDLCDSVDGCTHTPLPDQASCGVGKLCAGGKCVQG